MIEPSSLELLHNKKNLLAFSGGADSTALFFLLREAKIPFDIAIVDYQIRKQSKQEVAHAKELANIHNITCHTLQAPKITQNFEANARAVRYDFFESLIQQHGYQNLLTAHHLGDRFEWMLMQFCKGAGCAELVGMQKVQKRENYTLVRPLLHLDKQELLYFLHANKKEYFTDESNFDESIKRNEFRHQITLPLLEKYLGGIKKSFEYLDTDATYLLQEVEIETIKDFAYFKSTLSERNDIFIIDKYLKTQKYIMSAKERERIRDEKSVVVGRVFLVVKEHGCIFITPYSSQTCNMPKDFKEKMRTLQIDPKLRPSLFNNSLACKRVEELLR
ncbi:MAG: tRNA lysidine(34) synthetase TilS [Sulfurimonadaceae bacterium]|jgi:tRNA(Ile)-lysidine synthase|nr:tRNA lysidine(34) synthetase TilS [Sulfurimonadaceae bacterium]